jgi:diguanylate cyclase (GGDEF)-like protein
MNSPDSTSWARDIRRYVLQMLVLLIILVAVGACYKYWSLQRLEGIERDANSYHLAVNNHYLRAMEELRKIQGDYAFLISGRTDGEVTSPGLNFDHVQFLTMSHIVQQQILKALALENDFADIRFELLIGRLEQQLVAIDSTLHQLQENRKLDNINGSDIDRLLVTLEQMVRLHSAARESRMEEFQQQRQQQDLVFYILIAVLFIVGLLITYRCFRAIGRLITRQERTEEKMRHQAHFDALTNLPNRFLALDHLTLMIREARRSGSKIAVLFIDLDFFKKVNDMLGHVSGDKLLVEAAERLRKSVREGDVVGRLGGDEFIVLIGGISSEDEVKAIAENTIRKIAAPFQIDGREVMLSASAGISIYPDDGDENIELIRKADSAMYHSKDSGRNTYSFFTEKMNLSISRRLSLEEQIYGALDRGEFEVFYQQKVDVVSHRIVGAEALLRWNNKALGSVSPDEFIPVAEQTALIIPIGEWVIGEALKMTRQWQKLVPEFKVAVNISPRQFRDPDLVNNISRALHEAGVSSRDLELEITEGVLMSEYIEVERALIELTQLGVTIAMDDFGTGYSSLNYLRNYPFGVIKIDRSFIRDVNSNSMSEQLNHAAISMAHALGIKVVAEGVETPEQLAVLKELKCDVAQGYYFGKPMSAPEMTRLLESGRKASLSGPVVDIGAHHGRPTQTSLPGK